MASSSMIGMCGMDFGSAFALFEREYAAAMVRRQRDCLRQLASINTQGYWLADLPHVRRLLQLAMERLEGSPKALAPALVDVIRLFGLAPRTAKANEETVYAKALQGILNALASSLRAGEPRVELAAAETLLQYAKAVPAKGELRRPGDSRPTKWNTNHDLLRKSGAIALVADAFAKEVAELQEADVDGDGCVDMGEFYRFRMLNDGTTDNDDDATEAALLARGGGGKAGEGEAADAVQAEGKTAGETRVQETDADDEPETTWTSSEQFLDVAALLVREISEHPDGASALTACGAPMACLETVRLVASHKEPIVGTCLETLWNLCEHSAVALSRGVALSLPQLLRKHRAANAAHVLASGSALATLRGLFARAVEGGSSIADKALRNETIIVATVLARTPSPPQDAHAHAHASEPGDGASEADKGSARSAAAARALTDGTTPAVAALVESGMLEEALLYACAAELDVPTPASRRLFASHTEADLQLKVLLWELVASAVRTELDHRQSLRAFDRLRRMKDKRQLGAPRFWSRAELMRIETARTEVQESAAEAAREARRKQEAASAPLRGHYGEAAASELEQRRMEEAEAEAEAEAAAAALQADGDSAMLVDWSPGGPAVEALQASALVPALLTYLNPVDDVGSADPVVRALAHLADEDAPDAAATSSGGGGVSSASRGGHDEPERAPQLPPHPYVSRWSRDQKRRLELEALSILRLLGHHALPAIADADGCFVLVLYLRAHSAALRRRHGADAVAARAAATAARKASMTGRPAGSAGRGAATAAGASGGAGAGGSAGAGSLFTGDDASRQYCVLRLVQRLCSAPRGGAAIAAELGSLGLVGDVTEILRSAETAAAEAVAVVGAASSVRAVGSAAAMGLALSQPPGALRSAALQAGRSVGGGGASAQAASGGGTEADGAASPESGGPVPLGLLAEAACGALTALCGGCGVPRLAVTTAEVDEDEQDGAAVSDGLREAIEEAARREDEQRRIASSADAAAAVVVVTETDGQPASGGGAAASSADGVESSALPVSARQLSARSMGAGVLGADVHTVAPKRGGAAGAGRGVFRPNQKLLRSAGGIRLCLRWLAQLAVAQRAEIRARDAEAEASAPRMAAARARPGHRNARGEQSSILPARSQLGDAGADASAADMDAIGSAGAAVGGGAQRKSTATGTLMARAATASGFDVGAAGSSSGPASVAAGSMQRASTPLDGAPDAEPQLGAALVVALWAAVSGSRRAMGRAVEAGAVDSLLDWLEVCATRERGAVLGLLADLTLEATSKSQFRAWRSEVDGGGVASLLLRVWCEDEARMGVRHGHRGEIADLLRPLAGMADRMMGGDGASGGGGGVGASSTGRDDDGGVSGAFGRLREALRAAKMWDSVEGQQAAGDKDAEAVLTTGVVSTKGGGLPNLNGLCSGGDLRPKVWAVFTGLGWDAVAEGLAGDLAELPLTFRVALELSKALPDAKRGQAWATLMDELAGESLPQGLRAEPTHDDREVIDEGLREARAAAIDARAAQRLAAVATEEATEVHGEDFMRSVVTMRDRVEESARLAAQRRSAPKSLTFEERRTARDRKKEMLMRARGQAADGGDDDDSESRRLQEEQELQEEEQQKRDAAAMGDSGAYHPGRDWEVSAQDDPDSDEDD